MMKFLLTISLICWFQAYPSYGMDADNVSLNARERRIHSPRPNKARIEVKVTTASPKGVRNSMVTIPNVNLLGVKPLHGPRSPDSKARGSSSRPMSPNGSPRGEPMSLESTLSGSRNSTELSSSSLSSMSLSSESLKRSTDALNFSNEALPKTTHTKDRINHLAFIPDGHRRWSEAHGVANSVAYAKSALEGIPQTTRDVFSKDIDIFTVWLFSPDNWKRDVEEVAILMDYFGQLVDTLLPIAHELKFQIVHLGNRERIPKFLLRKLKNAQRDTSHYPDRIVNLAINSGGQDDVVRAIKKLAKRKPGEEPFDFENISAEDITDSMDTGKQRQPAPDLIIRTTIGDHKLSGFMSWFPHAKLHFSECYAPDFTNEHLEKAIEDFGTRARNFGK